MARNKIKTEHSGAKNGGGGSWGPRTEVKTGSNEVRWATDRDAVQQDWGEDVAPTDRP